MWYWYLLRRNLKRFGDIWIVCMRADLHHGHDWLPTAAYLPYFIIYLLYEPSVQGIMHVNLHKMYVRVNHVPPWCIS
jgi:hypothetical protein